MKNFLILQESGSEWEELVQGTQHQLRLEQMYFISHRVAVRGIGWVVKGGGGEERVNTYTNHSYYLILNRRMLAELFRVLVSTEKIYILRMMCTRLPSDPEGSAAERVFKREMIVELQLFV